MTTRRIAVFLIIIFSGFFAAYFLLRNYVLLSVIDKAGDKILNKYSMRLTVEKAAFNSFTGIDFENVSLVPLAGDTLFHCNKATVSISMLRYFQGLPPVDDFFMKDGFILLSEKNDSINNYDILVKGKEQAIQEDTLNVSRKDYGKTIQKIFHRFFKLSDFDMELFNFRFTWKAPGYHESVLLNNFRLFETRLEGIASDSLSASPLTWQLNGTIDPRYENLNLVYQAVHDNGTELPFVKKFSGLRVFLKQGGISMKVISRKKESFGIDIYAAAVRPGINHWRISPEDVIIDTIGLRMKIFVDDTSFRTSENSEILINKVKFYNTTSFSNNDRKIIGLDLRTDTVEAGDFFSSLPKGLFNTLDGFKASGKLQYKLRFHLDMKDPDQVVFDSQLSKKNFRIIKYGTENLSSLNGSFVYAAQEKGRIVKVFQVGPENPSFTPLNQISAYLINAVMIAEDGTFYSHNGFNEEAFRQSIATNIKEKRFARGGSTITMQLVKNVFLNRNKTVSRKVEEALLVWLIESNNLVSKPRLLEVYLNIIEWGPGVYGITEASAFYFNKKPLDLTLEESIYLSSIIPRPKYFRYSFDKDGWLKEYLQGYFRLVAGRMVKKEIITQTEMDFMKFQVELKGPALDIVVPPDTIPDDSEENDLF